MKRNEGIRQNTKGNFKEMKEYEKKRSNTKEMKGYEGIR